MKRAVLLSCTSQLRVQLRDAVSRAHVAEITISVQSHSRSLDDPFFNFVSYGFEHVKT